MITTHQNTNAAGHVIDLKKFFKSRPIAVDAQTLEILRADERRRKLHAEAMAKVGWDQVTPELQRRTDLLAAGQPVHGGLSKQAICEEFTQRRGALKSSVKIDPAATAAIKDINARAKSALEAAVAELEKSEKANAESFGVKGFGASPTLQALQTALRNFEGVNLIDLGIDLAAPVEEPRPKTKK